MPNNKKRSEEDIQELNEKLSAIINSSEDAIIGETLDGTVTSWNPGAERLYGFSESEMIGQSIKLVEPPEKGGEISLTLSRVKAGERIAHFDTFRLRKDGKRVWVSISASPIRNNKGEIIAAMTITHDISEQKRSNESQLILGMASRPQRLSTDLSEQINNPLETAKNALHVLLNRTPKDSDDRKLLEVAASAIERIIALKR